jgi:alpha/beta superfamily hydrolase
LGFPATFLDEPAPLDGGGKPRLFVQGERDQFGSGDALRSLVEPFPEGRSVVIIKDTDHFFDGRLDELQGAVHTWAEGRPWETREGDRE